MKQFVLTTVISVFFLACTHTGKSSKITPPEAKDLVDNFYKALSTGDTLLMNKLLTDDFEMYEHKVLWTQDSLLALMPLTKDRIWRIDTLTLQTEDELAHIYYYNESDRPKGKSWYESMLLTNKNGQWQIKFMQSTKRYLK